MADVINSLINLAPVDIHKVTSRHNRGGCVPKNGTFLTNFEKPLRSWNNVPNIREDKAAGLLESARFFKKYPAASLPISMPHC